MRNSIVIEEIEFPEFSRFGEEIKRDASPWTGRMMEEVVVPGIMTSHAPLSPSTPLSNSVKTSDLNLPPGFSCSGWHSHTRVIHIHLFYFMLSF